MVEESSFKVRECDLVHNVLNSKLKFIPLRPFQISYKIDRDKKCHLDCRDGHFSSLTQSSDDLEH